MAIPRLGSKGQGWVLLQVLLLLTTVGVGVLGLTGTVPRWPDGARGAVAVLGALLVLAGIAVFAVAVSGLGSALTANPAPLDDEALRSDGIYSVVRHPIYSGLILAALGFALITTPWGLVPVALLAVELDLKRRLEEEWLVATYPDYAGYRTRVPRALVPGLW
jgi:protein-S-isoprenylcysteine O-methyltransferase Ste14